MQALLQGKAYIHGHTSKFKKADSMEKAKVLGRFYEGLKFI